MTIHLSAPHLQVALLSMAGQHALAVTGDVSDDPVACRSVNRVRSAWAAHNREAGA